MMQIRRQRFSPGFIDYGGSVSVAYPAARALSLDAAEAWRNAIRPFVPLASAVSILDLGAGTGRFSHLLADFAGARVVAVEPSLDMLAVAARDHITERIIYVAGSAEAIPLCDESCDVAWLSHVLHHVRDRGRCAKELGRVVRSGGHVLIRGTFGDRLEGFPTLFRFFPGAREICRDLPTVDETVAAFLEHGFTLQTDRQVRQQTCKNLQDFAERTRLRADISLILLRDTEFHEGQVAIERAAMLEPECSPVLETLDLLVLRNGRAAQ